MFLSFHSFGLYVHNDTMQALGRPKTCSRIQRFSCSQCLLSLFKTSKPWLRVQLLPNQLEPVSYVWGGGCRGGWQNFHDADGAGYGGLYDPPYPRVSNPCYGADSAQGLLFARNSRLIPDKANLGFPAMVLDGWYLPSIRLGPCVLGLFWMFNTIAIAVYHFSWKMQSDVGNHRCGWQYSSYNRWKLCSKCKYHQRLAT